MTEKDLIIVPQS